MARHPWEITLRELIEFVRSNYGIELDYAGASVAGGRFLSKDRRVFPVPTLDLDETMPILLLQFFCRLYHVPPEDFGLPAEERD